MRIGGRGKGGRGLRAISIRIRTDRPNPLPPMQPWPARDGRVWAIASMVQGGVRGERDVRFWRDGETGFTPLPYTLDTG